MISFLGDEMYRCDECNRNYKYLRGLKAHKKYECGQEPQFICRIQGCTYRSKIKGNLKVHHLKKHGIIKIERK